VAILFLSETDPVDEWAAALARALPGEDVRTGPAGIDGASVEFAVAWRPPAGALAALPNLRAVFSLGAGVDHVLGDPGLPANLPVVRLIDPDLTRQMTEWVVMNVLRHHRAMPDYAAQQAEGLWREIAVPPARERRVGIMGLGVLGGAAATALVSFGFALAAWVRSRRPWPLGELFAGQEGLGPFLARTDILVCLLPLTAETRGILDGRAFAALPPGAAVINAARGGHLVEADLIAALESGKLSAATLDVFADEPLPPPHPFWRHPRITVTPHVAAVTRPECAAREIAANIRRCRAGGPMRGTVDRRRGY
jgi:glyoxylate/hydroxypyruvate reductase A